MRQSMSRSGLLSAGCALLSVAAIACATHTEVPEAVTDRQPLSTESAAALIQHAAWQGEQVPLASYMYSSLDSRGKRLRLVVSEKLDTT